VTAAAFGGGVYIADSSVWARAGHPALREPWSTAMRAGAIAACSIVKLELLYSARDAADFTRLDAEIGELRDIPVTASVQRAALAAMRALADQGPLHHRVPPADVLIAAAAQEAGIGVLHYDHHYDRLAEVLAFESRWAAEPGSL
jgi:predicted nucleic acid-binding protein